MALATVVKANTAGNGSGSVTTTSRKGTWVTAISNAKGTAMTSTERLTPLSITANYIVPIAVGADVSTILIRGKYNRDATGGTHTGIVRVFAIYGNPDDTPAFANDDTVKFHRIDADNDSAGLTLSIDTTNNLRDSAWKYTAPASIAFAQTANLMGAWHLLVILETASDVSGGTTSAATVEVLLLN